MIKDLFSEMDELYVPYTEEIADSAFILRHLARNDVEAIYQAIQAITAISPFRKQTVPNGHTMSVATTNCGEYGWTSDLQGYRYQNRDPLTHRPWPVMPEVFLRIAQLASHEVGIHNFAPNACLVNQYLVGSKMGLHQDKDEGNFDYPIVSISLGLPATFSFGGLNRTDPTHKYQLNHGDVVIWFGTSRLCYHGINPLKRGIPPHPIQHEARYNLTLRQVTLPNLYPINV